MGDEMTQPPRQYCMLWWNTVVWPGERVVCNLYEDRYLALADSVGPEGSIALAFASSDHDLRGYVLVRTYVRPCVCVRVCACCCVLAGACGNNDSLTKDTYRSVIVANRHSNSSTCPWLFA